MTVQRFERSQFTGVRYKK